MSASARNNVVVRGNGSTTMMFAHGYGCDQTMWRLVAPHFEHGFRVITFDHVGAGGSDLAAFDPLRYADLDGYAMDIVEIAREFGVTRGIFVGHSVAAMMGVLAYHGAPEIFDRLVLIGPSPRYLDDGDYRGGFTGAQIDELLAFLERNPMGWAATMAPLIMGNPDRRELSDELANSFCSTDPAIALHFARATFLADNRADLDGITVPTLILQCAEDIIAPVCVGEYVHAKIAGSTLIRMAATGHCPHLSAPEETVAAIAGFV